MLAGYTHSLLHRNPSAQTLAFHEAQLKLIELGWGRNDPGVQAMLTSRFMPDGNAEQLASFNEHQRLSCDGQRAAAIVRAKAGQDACVLAAKVQAPTLVLHSEGDLAIPLALRHELAARIPGARFELLRSRNHLPLPQEPAFARMCQVITEFVAHKPPPMQLTPRERELAGLVGQGLDNLQIAARLGLADKTVRNMLSVRTPSSAWGAAPWRSSKRGTWACTTGTELGHTGHLSRGHGLAMALK